MERTIYLRSYFLRPSAWTLAPVSPRVQHRNSNGQRRGDAGDCASLASLFAFLPHTLPCTAIDALHSLRELLKVCSVILAHVACTLLSITG